MQQLLLFPHDPWTPGVFPESTVLYCPPDVEEAHLAWKASCGPCALAAVLGVPVARVRRLFPDFPQRPWVNPSTMWTALSLARRPATKTGTQWPRYGLAFVQWEGPWLEPRVPIGAAYRYTHWVGVATSPMGKALLYDVNAASWLHRDTWETTICPLITATIPRATGGWHLRWTCAVEEGC